MRSLQPAVGCRPVVVVGLLIATWATAAFGNSLQPISILSWIHPFVLLLAFDSSLQSFRSAVLAYILVLTVQALGFTFAFAGALSYPTTTKASILSTLCLGLAASGAKTFGALLPARLLRHLAAQVLPAASRPWKTPDLSLLGWMLLALPLWTYPIFSSAVGTLTGFLFGHFADPAVAVLDWPAVSQLASLIGLWGVGFLLDLVASLAYILCTSDPLPLEPACGNASFNATTINPTDTTVAASGTSAPTPCHFARVCKPLRRHVLATAVTVGLLLVLGGGLVYSDSFYQRPIGQRLRQEHRLPVSCLTTEGADVGSGDYLWLWQKTAERVAAGDRIVLWSEAAITVANEEEELALLTSARDLLAAHGSPGGPAGAVGTYLGLCYSRILAHHKGRNGSNTGLPTATNQFALMDPNGTLLWNYHKAHPVPGVEDNVVPGPRVLPIAPSPYGTLGGAICFDMDWPSYIRQAGTAGVTLLLQPSWTWGDVGPRHFAGNALRAVENGFTSFRCSSSGVSGAVSPHGLIWHYLLTGPRDVLSFTLPLHPRTSTAYVAGGWAWEWANMAVAAALLALLMVPRPRLAAWVKGRGGCTFDGVLGTGSGGEARGDREPLLP